MISMAKVIRDGSNDNLSFNHGVEGDTIDHTILALRKKQAKNVFAILLLSQGVPMLLAGDEFLNTQRGNNNSYCQDNEISWLNWTLTETHADMLRFVRHMILLRKRHPSAMRRRFFTGKAIDGKALTDITWHGEQLNTPLWRDPEVRLLAFTLAGLGADEADLHIAMNMSDQATSIELPVIKGRQWCLSVDTGQASPLDIIAPENQQEISGILM